MSIEKTHLTKVFLDMNQEKFTCIDWNMTHKFMAQTILNKDIESQFQIK